MTLALAPDISFCHPDGGRIFLDIARDRYFCLGAPADEAFGALLAGTMSQDQRKRLDALVTAGILIEDPAAAFPRPCRPPPLDMSLLDEDLPDRAGIVAILGTVWAMKRAKVELGVSSLDRVCARMRALKEDHASELAAGAPDDLARIAAAFVGASRIVGALDQCLACSIALVRRCIGAGISADLVLGVRLKPFKAHAWAVSNGKLLSDNLATVRPFTPILVL